RPRQAARREDRARAPDAARRPPRRVRAAPLRWHEPRGDRAHAAALDRHRQEQPAPRGAPAARAAPGAPPVSFAHWRTRGRLGLLASDALGGAELEAARAHASECATCASELARMRLVLEQVALDPARTAELPIDTALLLRRTLARLDRAGAPVAARPRPIRLLAPLAAAVVIAIAVLVIRREAPVPEPARVASARRVTMPDESLRRLER